MRVTAVGREAMEEALEDMVALAMERVELRVGAMDALVDLLRSPSVLEISRQERDLRGGGGGAGASGGGRSVGRTGRRGSVGA